MSTLPKFRPKISRCKVTHMLISDPHFRSLLKGTGNEGHRRACECLWGCLCELRGSLWKPSGLTLEAFGLTFVALPRLLLKVTGNGGHR